MTTALIRTKDDGSLHVYTLKYNKRGNVYNVRDELVQKYDMSQIFVPKRRFRLSDENQSLFSEALKTQLGQKMINEMKNEKTDKIINEYFEAELKYIGKDESKEKEGHRQQLKEFIIALRKEKLVGQNRLSNAVLSISKREIWEELIKRGYIIPVDNNF
jgi:hypothetical protein